LQDRRRLFGLRVSSSAFISVAGKIPPEQWNRLGTRLIPKMRAAGSVSATIRLEGEVDPARAAALSSELQQVIDEIGLSASIRIERGSPSSGPAEGNPQG
jgi:hypothetical protein